MLTTLRDIWIFLSRTVNGKLDTLVAGQEKIEQRLTALEKLLSGEPPPDQQAEIDSLTGKVKATNDEMAAALATNLL